MSNAFQLNEFGGSGVKNAASVAVSRAQIAANDDNDFLRLEDAAGKWPAWKSTSFILLSCGAFWVTVAWATLRVFG